MAEPTILDCFQDLISIRGGCDDVIPTSGLYMDEIGLSLNNLDEFVTKDYKDSYDLFGRKRDFAMEVIAKQIHNHLSSKYLSNTLLEGQRNGFYQDNLQLISGASGIRKGLNLELQNCDSYVDLYLSEISLQVNYTGEVKVFIYDLMTGILRDTITINAVAKDVVTVYPAKTYTSWRKKLNLLFVTKAVDAQNNEVVLDAVKATVTSSGTCSDCVGNHSLVRTKAVTIPEASEKIKSNLQNSSDTGGLSVVYSLNCNHKQWLCSHSQSIALPLLYKTGAELMLFAQVAMNERVNTLTFANGDKLEQRLLQYEGKYAEAMDNLLRHIKPPSDSRCFSCNRTIVKTVALP